MSNRSLGVIILCLWGIATGLIALIPVLAFPLATPVLALVLIGSCILILAGR